MADLGSTSELDGPLLTVSEVAKTLNTSEQTIRRMAAERSLPAVRLRRAPGSSLRFRPSDVRAFIEGDAEPGG
jgi:excisionase family DNA binding protein